MAMLLGTNSWAKPVTLEPQRLTDNSGLIYIGYGVAENSVGDYLKQLQSLLGLQRFKLYRQAQRRRDHQQFHITLINPYEYPDVATINLNDIPTLSFELIGLGQALKGDNQTYFVVVTSIKAQQVRANYGLKAKDFHITLGFNKTDVFGVNKDSRSLVHSE